VIGLNELGFTPFMSCGAGIRSASREPVNTLRLFRPGDVLIPGGTSWYLADLGEFRGQQTLYICQAPQRLKALREHALIESAVSSNRIEGLTVETRRVRELILYQFPLDFISLNVGCVNEA
jgi:hypothetical protein